MSDALASVDWVDARRQLRRRLVSEGLLGALAPRPADHPCVTGEAPDAGSLVPPFAIGLTVGVADDAPGFSVRAHWTTEAGERVGGLRRLPNTAGLIGPWTLDDDHPGVVVRLHVHWHEADWIVSVLLVNEQDAGRILAPELVFESVDDDPIVVRRPWVIDPGEVSWVDYDYDPDFIPVHAAPARFGVGHGAALLVDLVDGAREPLGRRVRAVPFADAGPPPGDPAIEVADGAPGDAGVPLGECLQWDDAALQAALEALPERYEAWLAAERPRRPDASEGWGPFLNTDALSPARAAVVAEAVRAGASRVASEPLAGWALRMASWVVLRETGRARWRADELAWLLAMTPWALDGAAAPAADLVDFAPGGRCAAHLGLAALARAWAD